MKTTVDIPEGLFKEVKKLAKRDNTTLKALIEEGLRRVLEERKHRKSFRLRKFTFKGKGLQSHLAGKSWDSIREVIYEGRGD
jgi:mRNA-degrading endonuclease RelE of RelBE toxin-antitoxin system